MIRFVALGLLIPLMAATPSEAASAPVQARPAAVATSYDCSSDFGSGSGDVRVSVELPTSVKAGRRVGSRSAKAALTLPRDLVNSMRDFGVRSLEGSSDATSLRVGPKRVKVRDLSIPRTRVPAKGPMTLRGTGTAGAFTLRSPGSYAVRVHQRLVADITARIGSDPVTTTLTCSLAPGAPSRLGTLTVR